MSNIAEKTTFKIRNTKLQIPIVTLFTNDSVKLTKQLNDEFKRSISWNEYKTKTGSRNLDDNNLARFCLDDSFHGVKRFFFFLLLAVLILMLIKLKETVTENIVFQE